MVGDGFSVDMNRNYIQIPHLPSNTEYVHLIAGKFVGAGAGAISASVPEFAGFSCNGFEVAMETKHFNACHLEFYTYNFAELLHPLT